MATRTVARASKWRGRLPRRTPNLLFIARPTTLAVERDDWVDHVLTALDKVLAERKRASPDSSYVASLNAEGLNRSGKSVKATEVILAAKDAAESGEAEALVNEVADLWFHTLVMLSHLDLNHQDVLKVLDARMGLSGLAEKAARKGHNAASKGS